MAPAFQYLPAIALLATLTFTANVASADEKPLKETAWKDAGYPYRAITE
jgi:hypothetical protein